MRRPTGGELDSMPFVGRSNECRALAEVLGSEGTSVTPVVVISGPGGVGKTRLVREVLGRCERRSVWVRCWAGSTPMWCWSEILAQLDDDLELTAGGDRFELFSELRARLAAQPGLIVVIDDLHLADPASMLFLRFLARSTHGRSCTVLATVRPLSDADASLRPILGDVARESLEIDLAAFDRDESLTLLHALGTRPRDEAEIEALLTLTRGLPLAIERLDARTDGTGAFDLASGVAAALDGLDDDGRLLVEAVAVRGAPIRVAELATALTMDVGRVLDGVRSGAEAGFFDVAAEGVVTLTHDLVGEHVVAAMPPDRRLALDRAWWTSLERGDLPHRVAAAAHASAVAELDPTAIPRAVEHWFALAQVYRGRSAMEAAFDACEHAVTLADNGGLELTVDQHVVHADAALGAGRLGRARQLWRRAAETAERNNDARALADAAAGLGGMWLQEHRDDIEAAAVSAMQRRALEAVEPLDSIRALRLRVRLSAEAAYRGRDATELLGLLDECRRIAPPRLLAETLSLVMHATLGPQHTERRLEWAGEMAEAAYSSADPILALLGHCWTTVAHVLAGEDASHDHVQLRLRSEALGCTSMQFIVEAMNVGSLIRSGRLDDAEIALAHCFELGSTAGDADAANFASAHLAIIRWYQGRQGELVEHARAAAMAPTILPGERALATTAALFALEAGDPEPARRLVRMHLARPEPEHYQQSSWLVAMHALARIAVLTRDRELGEDIVSRIEAHRHLPTVLSMAVADLGPVEWTAGLALFAAGRSDDAIEALGVAHTRAERAGHVPATVYVAADLALALHAGGRLDEATAALADAARRAEPLGIGDALERWRAAIEPSDLGSGSPAAPGRRDEVRRPSVRVTFERLDRLHWRCTLGGGSDDRDGDSRSVLVTDTVGIRHLATLCASPDLDIPASRLAYPVQSAERRHEVLDETAITALRDRAAELRRLLDDDIGPRAEWENELDAISHEMLTAMGLGSTRGFADAEERARTAVRKAITRAIQRIAEADRAIAQHLEERIVTGHLCRYAARR